MKLKNFHSKLILFFALTMMVSSALISYFMVRQNEPKISSLRIEANNKETLIRDIWNNIGKKESTADTAILVSILSEKYNKDTDTISLKKHYLSGFLELTENSTALEIANMVEKEKAINIQHIDNLYLEQNAIQNKVSEIERKNKLYSDIAFLLQILSLVLIILKKEIPA